MMATKTDDMPIKVDDATCCRKNGWTTGDILEGDEGFGPERIVITAIGQASILARLIDRDGNLHDESLWTLRYRQWRKVGHTNAV